MFRTYEAEHDRLVAVKALRLDLTPEQLSRLVDELQRIAELKLSHQSLVKVLGAGLEGTTAYVAEEYVAAESLDVALRHYAPAPLQTVLPFLRQLAGAIDFAWGAGVGHGALHPRDIFLTPDQARATGFGMAKALEQVGLRPTVRRPYSAPERIAGEDWGTEADVYALASIAYELLTAKRVAGTGEQLLTGTVADSNVTAAVRDVLGTALASEPSRRYPSALVLVAALEASLKRDAAGASTATGDPKIASSRGTPVASAMAASVEPVASSEREGIDALTDPGQTSQAADDLLADVVIRESATVRAPSSVSPPSAARAADETPASTPDGLDSVLASHRESPEPSSHDLDVDRVDMDDMDIAREMDEMDVAGTEPDIDADDEPNDGLTEEPDALTAAPEHSEEADEADEVGEDVVAAGEHRSAFEELLDAEQAVLDRGVLDADDERASPHAASFLDDLDEPEFRERSEARPVTPVAEAGERSFELPRGEIDGRADVEERDLQAHGVHEAHGVTDATDDEVVAPDPVREWTGGIREAAGAGSVDDPEDSEDFEGYDAYVEESVSRRNPWPPALADVRAARWSTTVLGSGLLAALIIGFIAGYLWRSPATPAGGSMASRQPVGAAEPIAEPATAAPEPQPTVARSEGPDETDAPRPASPVNRAEASEPPQPAPAPPQPTPTSSRASDPPAVPQASNGPVSAASNRDGRLLIRTTPAGADVTVDGRTVGRSPVVVRDLEYGAYTVRVSLSGFVADTRRLTVTRERPASAVTIELERAEATERPAVAAAAGSVYIDSRPRGARVSIDGQLLGTTPLQVPGLAVGSHDVRLELEGYRTWTSSVQVRAGQRNRVNGSLEPQRP